MQRPDRLFNAALFIPLCVFAVSVASEPPSLDSSSLVQPAVTPEERLAELVQRLGADALSDREAASQALRADSAITLPMIESLIAGNGELTPEQVERLSQVGEVMFGRQRRAAMGVSFSWGEDVHDGVQISGTINGFDSQRVLQPGDVIQSIDGVRLLNQSQTRAVIVSHSPGDSVTLRVIRGGEPMTVNLTLGDYADLEQRSRGGFNQGFAGQDSTWRATLRQAWNVRLARTLGRASAVMGEEVNPGLSDRQWGQLDQARGRGEDARAAGRIAAANTRRVPQAGGARIMVQQNGQILLQQAQREDEEPSAEAPPAGTVTASGSDRLSIASSGGGFSLAATPTAPRSELQDLLVQHDQMIATQRAMLDAAVNLPPQTRALLTEQLKRLQMERNQIRAKLMQQGPRMGGVEP